MSPDHLTQLIIAYRYWIIIPLTFLEGPIVAFVAGSLAALGYFNPYFLFVIFFVRDVSVDLFCYLLGRFAWHRAFVRRFLAKAGVTEEEIRDIRPLWLKNPGKTMFFSKLSYGVAAGLIMVAGVVEMPLSKFIAWGAAIAVMHYGVLLVLGYYFGGAFGSVSKILQNISYVIGGIFLVMTAYYFFKRYMRTRLLKEEKEEAEREAPAK